MKTRFASLFVAMLIARASFALDINAGEFALNEYNKTVAGRNVAVGEGVTVSATLSRMICGVPSLAFIQESLQLLANNGRLPSTLDVIESALQQSEGREPEMLKQAFITINVANGDVVNSHGVSATADHATARNTWANGQPLVLTFNGPRYRNCLTAADARSWHQEIIRIGRAYLGTQLPLK